ncbi:hypothetical protein CEK26_008533 [Fusarium fujikuroi]|uniref:Uncharacterized protein n=1 Tax=Fusarium fujikuroi TaxID=5127 RepID=A0A5Q3DDR3_FUSFU|nr:hypothetical protein CEK27_008550 [Fusarium fujikuroi]QGI95464.1 hypothetical protein CEK26_008533 [Fusarium fujikuroi]VTT70815.1 unnamed protein product [Fusarium fujikuroi]VTT71735.1 unnamed protein product [Fusarium fujikuroi]
MARTASGETTKKKETRTELKLKTLEMQEVVPPLLPHRAWFAFHASQSRIAHVAGRIKDSKSRTNRISRF